MEHNSKIEHVHNTITWSSIGQENIFDSVGDNRINFSPLTPGLSNLLNKFQCIDRLLTEV